MGDVVSLFREDVQEVEVSWNELSKTVNRAATRQLVLAQLTTILGLSKESMADTPAVSPDLGRLRGEIGPAGAMYPVSRAAGLIVAHENFPLFLSDQGLDAQEALELAGTSIVAYNWWNSWWLSLQGGRAGIVDRHAQKKVNLPAHPEYWDPLAYEPSAQRQNFHTVLHRMAATTALEACELLPITPEPRALPIHVAALADPFNALQVKTLFATARTFS